MERLKRGTVEDVVRHLGMSWDMVKEIHLWTLERKFKKKKLKNLKYFGVDEIAVRRGYSYLTVVVDLETGQMVWVKEDRPNSSLQGFMITLKQRKVGIKAITMDMWLSYIKVVSKYYL